MGELSSRCETERARPLKIKEFPFQIINEVNTMALDAATLALTAAELKATLTDAKIAKLNTEIKT